MTDTPKTPAPADSRRWCIAHGMRRDLCCAPKEGGER